MIKDTLIEAGLEPIPAEIYGALVEYGAQTAGELLERLSTIKRPTLYKELRALKELGIVSEGERDGKILFAPLSPDALVMTAMERKKSAEADLQKTERAVASLKTKFLVSSQRPDIRYHEGAEGLKDIYDAQIAAKEDVYIIRASTGPIHQQVFGKWWAHHLNKKAELGIRTFALTPDHATGIHDKAADEARHVFRTWLRPEDYVAPVDINVWGDTVAIISYGKDIFGITMRNKDIAEAFRSLMKLAEKGAKSDPPTHDHA